MSLRCLTLVAVCVVFISTEAVSGEDVTKSVGDEVSFRPAKVPSITSITWKQINSGIVVKVIEWDVDDGVFIPNPRFQGITTLDEKTGQITITNLKVEHSGLYSIDINSKEQQQRFSLTVMVSTKTCGREQLENMSCTIQLPTKNIGKSNEIIWTHLSTGDFILRNNGKIRKNTPGLSMEEDGSLSFESVGLNNTGKYRYTVFNAEGTQIDAGEKEIKVYATAPKPTVTYETRKVLICNIGDRTDLTVSWYVGDKIIQNEKNPHLVLTTQMFTHVLENKPFSCSVSNPVSNEKSDSLAVLENKELKEF